MRFKKMVNGSTLGESWTRSKTTLFPQSYHIPDEWVKAVLKPGTKMYKELTDFYTLDFMKKLDMTFFTFNEQTATRVCRLYLKTKKMTEYPLLIGIHPLMDKVLKQEFRKIET